MSKASRLICNLSESAIRNLYHTTSVPKALQILKDDMFRLTFAGGTQSDEEINKKRLFFLSTARTKYGRYAGSEYKNIHGPKAIFALNGHRIANNYKVYPIDYWNSGHKTKEDEERIVSDKPTLGPLANYVDALHLYVGGSNANLIRAFFEMQNTLEQAGFPIWFYSEGQEAAFKAHRTEKATRDFKEIFNSSPQKTQDDLDREEFMRKYPDKGYPNLEAIVAIYHKKAYPENMKRQREVWNKLRYPGVSGFNGFLADAHNARSSHDPVLIEIAKIIKHSKSGNFKELLQRMSNAIKDKDFPYPLSKED